MVKYIKEAVVGAIALSGIGIFAQKMAGKIEQNSLKRAYGYSVSVKGYDMTVEVRGTGNEVIVLLPGFGSVSPVLEFRNLAKQLEKNYTVVIPEYFGYGLSDSTGQDRTVQRIASELHECLQKVGFHQYYFAAHSISGIYSLYYANRYPNEVKGFIGIDSSVPGQWERTPDKWKKLQKWIVWGEWLKINSGWMRLKTRFCRECLVPQIKGQVWSGEEKRIYRRILLNRSVNRDILSELALIPDNLKAVRNLKFPENLPVLQFISVQNRVIEGWEQLHRDVIEYKEKSQVYLLDGGHYLHYEYGTEIAERIHRWIVSL